MQAKRYAMAAVLGLLCLSWMCGDLRQASASCAGDHQARQDAGCHPGALHAEGFRGKTVYTPERLRDILIALKPDIILHEVPPRYCLPWGSPPPVPKIWGGEAWSCNQAAQRLWIPLKPCDRADRDEYREKTHYWARNSRADSYIDAWFKRMRKDESNSVEKGFYEMLRAIEGPRGLPCRLPAQTDRDAAR